jgi:hypothetical protein
MLPSKISKRLVILLLLAVTPRTDVTGAATHTERCLTSYPHFRGLHGCRLRTLEKNQTSQLHATHLSIVTAQSSELPANAAGQATLSHLFAKSLSAVPAELPPVSAGF